MTRKRWAWLIVGVGVLIGLLWLRSGTRGPSIEPGSTLLLDVSGEYIESPAPPRLARLMGERRQPLVSLLSTLALVRRDPRIATVVLRMRGLDAGWGQAQEIRDAVGELRAHGKRVIAHLELARFDCSRDYLVASAANEVVVSPGSITPLVGLAAEYLFLGGVWEKLGVQIESERIGRYKSAVDSYTGREMSPAHREMAESLLDSFEAQWLGAVAEGRGLTPEQVRAAVDAGPVRPDELVELKLADRVAHLRELDAMDDEWIEADDYARVDPASLGFEAEARFALVYGSGTVVTGEGGRSPRGGPRFASDTVSEALERAAEDAEIDAIVLRIDSPGGSSLASELVWQALQRARASGKPVIASLGNVAASGGYYVAVGSDHIVADPGVLTGSIGVFVLRPVLGGLLEKLGIGVEGLTRGRHADFLLSSRPLSAGAQERLRRLVDDTYALFVKRVAEGRKLDATRVDQLGQGRVWTGSQALERGLVDELGGLRTAVAAGRRALGLAEDADVALVPYPPPRTLAEELAELLQGRVSLAQAAAAAGWLSPDSVLEAGGWRWPRSLRPLRDLAAWAELPARAPLLLPPVLVDVR